MLYTYIFKYNACEHSKRNGILISTKSIWYRTGIIKISPVYLNKKCFNSFFSGKSEKINFLPGIPVICLILDM